jgi:hypothetical protein
LPPIVTVLMGSKPATDAALAQLPVVLSAFQGGQACGQAVAEVALGLKEPFGSTPQTGWSHSSLQLYSTVYITKFLGPAGVHCSGVP